MTFASTLRSSAPAGNGSVHKLDWSHPVDEIKRHVELYTCAWVPGARVLAYIGPITSELFLRDADVVDRSVEWTEAQCKLLELLRSRALIKRANAVIGLEISLDPFARCPQSGASGLHLHAVGTAAMLEANGAV